MVKRKIFLLVAILLLFAGTVRAAQLIPDPDVQGKIRAASQPITLEGRIIHRQVGGYLLQADRAGDKIILNQNYQVLKSWPRNAGRSKLKARSIRWTSVPAIFSWMSSMANRIMAIRRPW